jgi:uncharacterized protein
MKPARLAVAAVLGDGKQIVSWIHHQDLSAMILFAVTHKNVEGIFNAVAPVPVNNETLTLQIASKYHSWHLKVFVPAWALKMLLGEMSIEVLKSAHVSSKKIQEQGFEFKYPIITSALDQLLPLSY